MQTVRIIAVATLLYLAGLVHGTYIGRIGSSMVSRDTRELIAPWYSDVPTAYFVVAVLVLLVVAAILAIAAYQAQPTWRVRGYKPQQ